MFDLFKKRTPPPQSPQTPEALGLRLGGAVEFDDLSLKLIEPDVIFNGASRKQLIQAVGEVALDESTRLLRYYTDDDGYIQILQQGGTDDAHVVDVKLWYFYDTRPIDGEGPWQRLLNQEIVQPLYSLESHQFSPVWPNEKPVAVTEKTVNEDGTRAETDQFMMLYERSIANERAEFVLICGEEKLFNDQLDRSLVISTGINLGPVDFKVIG